MKNEKYAKILVISLCVIALIAMAGIIAQAASVFSNVPVGDGSSLGSVATCSHKNTTTSIENIEDNHVNHSVTVTCTDCSKVIDKRFEVHSYESDGDTVCTVCGHICVHKAVNAYEKIGDGTHGVYPVCAYCKGVMRTVCTIEACTFDSKTGTCTICKYTCPHTEVANDGSAFVCNLCGLELVRASINIMNGAGGWFYFLPGMNWHDMVANRYEIKNMEGQFWFSIGYDVVTVFHSSGVVALDGVPVYPDDVVVANGYYTMVN